MHGGEVDEGYCIVNDDALEDSVTQISRRQKNSGYFEGIDEVTELNDGYCFHFPAKSEPMEKLLELIKVERKIILLSNLRLLSRKMKLFSR
jgi:hypothetical protein